MADNKAPSHADSVRDYAVVYFRDNKVIAYGLNSIGGGSVTVMSFVKADDAAAFFADYGDPAKGDALFASQVVMPRKYRDAVDGISDEVIEETSFLVSAL
jgi:hypothetical protein